MTDSQGNYTMNVRPAPDYKVGVWHPDYVPQFYDNKTDWMQATLVDVSSGSGRQYQFCVEPGRGDNRHGSGKWLAPAADQWATMGG